MRHRRKGKILKRKTGARRALSKSLMRSLILYGKTETTLTKAKVLRREIEHQVTKARKGTLSERRQLGGVLDPRAAKKMFDELGPRYKDRNGGYTRIMKKSPRKGDRAHMAIIEFV